MFYTQAVVLPTQALALYSQVIAVSQAEPGVDEPSAQGVTVKT